MNDLRSVSEKSPKKLEVTVWPPIGDVPPELLNLQVTQAEFPVHIKNALNNMNVQTIRDLIGTPKITLQKALGKRRLGDVAEKLKDLGIGA